MKLLEKAVYAIFITPFLVFGAWAFIDIFVSALDKLAL